MISLLFDNPCPSHVLTILCFRQDLILRVKLLYQVFGSGSFHGPHAQFKIQAKLFNSGRVINLLYSVDIRIAGFHYAIHRALHMRKTLEVTVISQKWEALKKKSIMNRATEDVRCAKYWKRNYVLLRSLWPLLKLLCLADANKPGMDNCTILRSKHCL